jgi:hypothetical protein
MFDRDDLPGFLLLGLCGVVAVALLIEIFTDYSFRFSGPSWAGNAIAIVGIGLVLFMSWRAWGSRIKRWRGGEGGGAEWPKNDVRGQRNWPRRRDDQSSPDPAPDQPDPSDPSRR